MTPTTPGYIETAEKKAAFSDELELGERLILRCIITTGKPQQIAEVSFDLTALPASEACQGTPAQLSNYHSARHDDVTLPVAGYFGTP